jgi:sister chromatid cohesion protein DCC1
MFGLSTILQGNYLCSGDIPSPRGIPSATLQYFPSSSLPLDAAARFADLFLTRPKWRADTITPFLQDIAFDTKQIDKLLLKFCRMTKDETGVVWYTARAKY